MATMSEATDVKNDTNLQYEDSFQSTISLQQSLLTRSTKACIVLGGFVNIFLLVAIMTSPVLRLKLRNQILAVMCVCFLLEIIIESTVDIVTMNHEFSLFCELLDGYNYIHAMLDFISTWYIVELIIIYIAQLKDIDPSKLINIKCVKFATLTVLTLPLILSSVIIPPFIKANMDYWSIKTCTFINFKEDHNLMAVTITIPLLSAILLLLVALVCYWRRFRKGLGVPSDHDETVSQRHIVDKPFAYLMAMFVSIACYITNVLHIIADSAGSSKLTLLRVYLADEVLQDVFTYVLPLSWLFFDDVRERIKTCGSWCSNEQNDNQTATTNDKEFDEENGISDF
ncbi:uncharacterized protein LOC131949055 [Physella acuta]|uniref:uncharacterized protein LOC131949055 n=1 Tax=Physella acuta TaxID=109671 RepID=UPI0027DDC05A|nr:uncharacterized protein LOC131949055 [Physella acuta]